MSGRAGPSRRSQAVVTGGGVASCSERRCGWCRSSIEVTQQKWCSKRCRQTAWRMRKISVAEDLGDTPKRLVYADPPYPGMSRKYYRDEPSYAGEVDHAALIASLGDDYDGWALSTSARALRDVLPLCPPEARVAAWVKPIGAAPATRGPHNTWEPIIYVSARLRRPGFRDWASIMPARGGGELPGRKPIGFCAWMFRLLGAAPCDELADLFPGTGVVSRAWGQFCASAQYSGDASTRALSDVSVAAPRDTSRPGANDVSPAAARDVASPPRPSPRYRDDVSTPSAQADLFPAAEASKKPA